MNAELQPSGGQGGEDANGLPGEGGEDADHLTGGHRPALGPPTAQVGTGGSRKVSQSLLNKTGPWPLTDGLLRWGLQYLRQQDASLRAQLRCTKRCPDGMCGQDGSHLFPGKHRTSHPPRDGRMGGFQRRAHSTSSRC